MTFMLRLSLLTSLVIFGCPAVISPCQWSAWTFNNYQCWWEGQMCRVFSTRSCSCSGLSRCGSVTASRKVSGYLCNTNRCKHALRFGIWEGWTPWSIGCPSYRQRVQRCEQTPDYTNSSNIVNNCDTSQLIQDNTIDDSCKTQLGLKIGVPTSLLILLIIGGVTGFILFYLARNKKTPAIEEVEAEIDPNPMREIIFQRDNNVYFNENYTMEIETQEENDDHYESIENKRPLPSLPPQQSFS